MNVNQLNRLSELRFLSGDFSTADRFEETYEKLMNENKTDKEMLRAMRRVLLKQAEFLMNQWLAEKRSMPDTMRLTQYGKWN